MSALTEALQPLKSRMSKMIREFEILRISAKIEGGTPITSASNARHEVLKWVERKAGRNLPPEAWDSQDYEFLHGGRNSSAARLINQKVDIWSLRTEDPDKTVPGRVWIHEIAIGGRPSEAPMLSVRQLVSTPEEEPLIEPSAPGFMFHIAGSCDLTSDWLPLSLRPVVVASSQDAEELADQLVDTSRTLPIFAMTLPEGVIDPNQTLVDGIELAKAVFGFGRVVILPAEHTWVLTERFEKKRGVFGGAVRAYLPGFSEEADPYSHRLVIADRIREPDGAAQCLRWMRNLAAAESIRHGKLGSNVVPFSQVKNAALQIKQQILEETGASEGVKLAAMRNRLAALEEQVKRLESESAYYVEEHSKIEIRAQDAELQNRALTLRVQHLAEQLSVRGPISAEIDLPSGWSDFATWCESTLAGKLVLTPIARRGLRKPEFEDVELAARCLKWLATKARESLMGQTGLVLSELPIEVGVRNAHCGSDQFDLDWNGRRFTADWHVKNGGNTRDPKRCLRIYYFWDDETNQIVIADMPAHRRSAAS
jgi:hypothetical protein